MDSSQYQYSPLLSPDSFRIIILHPSPSINTPISCTLLHSSLLHFDASIVDFYTTLSYVWGDANSRCTISVNGKSLSITTSLDTALRHMRDREQEMKVWADGICIDQSSVEDKNKQVGLMGVIYGLARHTIIYLGEPSSETDAVFEAFASQKSAFDEKMNSGFMTNVLRESSGSSRFRLPNSEFLNLVENHVLNRTWFSRTWILQELVLSADPWLQIGSRRVRWNQFSDLIQVLRNPAQLDHHNVKSMLAMHTVRNEFVDTMKLARNVSPCDFLLQILHSRRGSGVFDPRDMLYAHLGMHQPGEGSQEVKQLISVDYQKSVMEVYTDLALYLLRSQRGFGFLSHVEDRPLEDRNPDLPSWAPDWTSPFTSPDAQFHLTDPSEMSSVDKIHTIVGTPRVLGCVGDVIGQIECIVEDKPSAAQFEKLIAVLNDDVDDDDYDDKVQYSDEEEEETSSPLVVEEEKQKIPSEYEIKDVVRVLYEHLRIWVDKHYLPDWEDLLEHRSEEYWEDFFRQLKRRISTYPVFDPTKFPRQQPYTEWWKIRDGKHKSEKEIIRQLILAFTADDVETFLAGKKLAFLDNEDPGVIALVPASSQVGDFVCRFSDNHSVPYVLRKVEGREFTVLDKELIKFFEKGKNEAREKFVEYTEQGEIIWKMDDLEDGKKVILGATIELWSEYKDEKVSLHAEGRRQRQEADKDMRRLSPEVTAQLKELSDEVMQAMGAASEEEKRKLWSSYIDTKEAFLKHQNRTYQLNPELKKKLDELCSKVIRATNLASEEEVLLQQVDTSDVNHVYLIGECIVDEISPELPSTDEEEHQIREFKDKGPQFIIALH